MITRGNRLPSISSNRTRRSSLAIAVGAACASLATAPARADNPAEALELPTVEVVGTSPLPGLGTPIRDIPANVQIHTGKDVMHQRQSNIGEYLEQNPTSVTINSGQGNPFQADVNFRGFTASPVLGTPQGLSVFQDGVRINEPFGDVVNWDLIPQSAISSIQLVPGSNPAFGLNTLGGALGVYTKSGSQYPGGSVEAYTGSYGRKGAEIEHGGKNGNFDYFVTGNFMEDNGWAEHNPSTVRQFFGKVGWQDDKTDFDVSLTVADNVLEGTQALPKSFFDNIRQAYTWPDKNTNELTFLTAKGSRFLSDNLILGGNAYYRKYKNTNVSSNVNDGYDGVTDLLEATNDRSIIDQDSYGFGLQLTSLGKLAGRDNQLSLGFSADFGKARFTQEDQDAAFTTDRGTTALTDFTSTTDAETRNAYYGLFFVDTLKLNAAWTLTASGRYNFARVKIHDLSGSNPDLDGNNNFHRFNPAVGVNYNPNDRLTAYATYNEGSRAPTPIELACADPNAPCKLPNNFLSDPPLNQVVSRTLEAGLRGRLGQEATWSLAAYRTELSNDIQFISALGGGSNAGYFQNVGKTRRQGVEMSLGNKWGDLTAILRYSYTDATFQSPFTVHSPNNSSADGNGDILVSQGSHIPGIPRHSIKLRLQYDFAEKASLGLNINYSSSVYARGDENNQDQNGRVPGYTVVNLDGHYAIAKDVEIFARVANLFDKKYANFGILGENFFTGPGRTFDGTNAVAEQFRGPGAPRGGWIGVRYQWK